MIDLGIIQLPLEAINMLVIFTALILAAKYIGYDIIASIGGVVAIVYGFRVTMQDYELSISGYVLGIYEGALLLIVGGFLLYRGTGAFFGGRDVNTWK